MPALLQNEEFILSIIYKINNKKRGKNKHVTHDEIMYTKIAFVYSKHACFVLFFLIAATAKSEINLVHLNLKRLYIRTPDDAAQKSNTRLAEGNLLLPGTNETKRSEEKMLLHRHRHRLLCCGGGVATAPGRFAGDAIADHQQAAAGAKNVAATSSARQLSWAQVEAMTRGFTSAVVGEGGFSTVYLGRVAGSLAAVKVHRSSERLQRAFRQELDALLRVRHPHIVRLLAFCDQRGIALARSVS